MTQTDVDSEDALIQAMQDDLELVVMREVCESIQTEKGYRYSPILLKIVQEKVVTHIASELGKMIQKAFKKM